MRFYGWMHKILMQKNVTLYCSCDKDLYMQSVTFISSISQVRIKLIFFTLISHTYLGTFFIACTDENLLEGSYSIHR